MDKPKPNAGQWRALAVGVVEKACAYLRSDEKSKLVRAAFVNTGIARALNVDGTVDEQTIDVDNQPLSTTEIGTFMRTKSRRRITLAPSVPPAPAPTPPIAATATAAGTAKRSKQISFAKLNAPAYRAVQLQCDAVAPAPSPDEATTHASDDSDDGGDDGDDDDADDDTPLIVHHHAKLAAAAAADAKLAATEPSTVAPPPAVKEEDEKSKANAAAAAAAAAAAEAATAATATATAATATATPVTRVTRKRKSSVASDSSLAAASSSSAAAAPPPPPSTKPSRKPPRHSYAYEPANAELNRPYPCPHCVRDFFMESALRKHLHDKHSADLK